MKYFLSCLLLLCSNRAVPWGFQAHRTINYHAVFLLPPALFTFYKPHIQKIHDWATKADQRRYIVHDEGMKHFIDLDHYETSLPLDTIGLSFDSAVNTFGIDSLKLHGILPWNILNTFESLKWAFLRRETDRILKLSADLGHYIADAHVPLHSCSNYNGQKTGQDGIHALWESRLPELFMANYTFFNVQAVYLDSPPQAVWSWIAESYQAVDSVLRFELLSRNHFPEAHGFELKAGRTVKVYHADFCSKYHQLLNNMVQRRMTQAIRNIANMWYTAWRDAGQLIPQNTEEHYYLPDSFLPSTVQQTNRTNLH